MRLGITLLLIGGTLGLVLVLGKKQPENGISNSPAASISPGHANVPPNRQGLVGFDEPVKIVIECEHPEKLEDKAPNGVVAMRIGSMEIGEKIGYLEIPNGWIQQCGLEEDKGKPGHLPGKAHYSFDIEREDRYSIFLRAKWYDTCGNSVYLILNDTPYTIDDTIGQIDEKTFRWDWHPVMEKGEIKTIPLKAGRHSLIVATKEDGPMLDKILITTETTAPPSNVLDP